MDEKTAEEFEAIYGVRPLPAAAMTEAARLARELSAIYGVNITPEGAAELLAQGYILRGEQTA